MIAIGRYLILIISMVGMTLSDDDIFSKENRRTFLDHIFNLHNTARIKHRVDILKRLEDLDTLAFNLLHNKMSSDRDKYYTEFGVNYHMKAYDVNTKLDFAEAEALFSEWYNKGDNYNYLVEPSNNDADAFTQIVWMDTQFFGIAIARTKDHYIVIAVYCPPGNEEKKYKNNVLKPSSMDQGGPSVNN